MNRILSLARTLAACAATLLLAVVVTAATSRPSLAQSFPGYYNTHVLPILPYRGMYWQPGHGGTGLSLDVDETGYVFGIFYSYDADGNGHPTYYMIEGQYQQNSDNDRIQSGILGTMDATPYTTANGECIGAGCTYQNPDRAATTLHVHLEWTAPRRVTVTIGNQSWQMQGGQYKVANADLLLGQWAPIQTDSQGIYAPTALHPTWVMTFTRSTLTPADLTAKRPGDEGYYDGMMVIPSDAVLYDVTLAGYPASATKRQKVWYDPATGRAGQFNIVNYDGGPDVALRYSDFYIMGPQTLRGRNMNGVNDAVYGDITMVRVYPGTIMQPEK